MCQDIQLHIKKKEILSRVAAFLLVFLIKQVPYLMLSILYLFLQNPPLPPPKKTNNNKTSKKSGPLMTTVPFWYCRHVLVCMCVCFKMEQMTGQDRFKPTPLQSFNIWLPGELWRQLR